MKKIFAVIVAFTMLLGGCGYKQNAYFYFDSPVTVVLAGSGAAGISDRIADLLAEIHSALDPENENSAVHKFNALASGGSVALDGYSLKAVAAALELADLTDGAYNPLIYPLVDLWGFSHDKFDDPDHKFSLPSDERIAAARALCALDGVTLEGNILTKNREGVMLDLGGVAKGLAADEVYALLQMENVRYGYVNVGSSSICLLEQTGGKEWSLGLNDPYGNGVYAHVPLKNALVSTSGDYERYYDFGGKRYPHVIDPASGRPIANGMNSATVVAESALLADALSTAMLVMGMEKAIAFCDNYNALHADTPLKIFLLSDGVFYTNSENYSLDVAFSFYEK